MAGPVHVSPDMEEGHQAVGPHNLPAEAEAAQGMRHPGPFSCYTCKEKKRLCDKRQPCGRCIRLGLECVMQKRGRGRPPRRSDSSPQPMLAQSEDSSEADDGRNTSGDQGATQSPVQVPLDQEMHVRVEAGNAPAHKGSENVRKRGSVPSREHQAPREARDPQPRRPRPAQPPPLHNGASSASFRARSNTPPTLHTASPPCPPSCPTPLDVLSSVAFSIVAAIPSPVTTSSTSTSSSCRVTASQAQCGSHGAPALTRSPPPFLAPPRAAVGDAASRAPPCSDAFLQLVSLAGRYEARANGRAADAYEEKREDTGLRAQWGPDSMVASESPMVGQVLVGPDQLTVVFETLATTVSRLRLREQIDPRKAEFVRNTIEFLFYASGETFAGPQYLMALRDAAAHAEAQARDSFRHRKLQRYCSPSSRAIQAEERCSGGLVRRGPGGVGRWPEPGGGPMARAYPPVGQHGSFSPVAPENMSVSWVMELLETPGMAGAYFHLQRPDVVPDETMLCNETMNHLFVSTEELEAAALQLHTTLPTVLGRLMSRQSAVDFYAAFAHCMVPGVHEAECKVEMYDRHNQVVHCLATLRWTYTFDSVYLAVGLAALQPNGVCHNTLTHTAGPSYYQRAWPSAP